MLINHDGIGKLQVLKDLKPTIGHNTYYFTPPQMKHQLHPTFDSNDTYFWIRWLNPRQSMVPVRTLRWEVVLVIKVHQYTTDSTATSYTDIFIIFPSFTRSQYYPSQCRIQLLVCVKPFKGFINMKSKWMSNKISNLTFIIRLDKYSNSHASNAPNFFFFIWHIDGLVQDWFYIDGLVQDCVTTVLH